MSKSRLSHTKKKLGIQKQPQTTKTKPQMQIKLHSSYVY